jgi:ribosome-binding protein aMBF1 (putative translation factor)
MIKNERQYKISKTQLKKFIETYNRFGKQPTSDVHPALIKAQKDAMKSQIEDLDNEIQEYENLKHGKYKVLKLKSIDEFPRALIRARIALGLTQKDLAHRLGLQEQQIQRYEETDYASISISRLISITHALDLKITEDIILPIKKHR